MFPFKHLNSNLKISITFYKPAISQISNNVKISKIYFNIKSSDNPDLFKALKQTNMYGLIENYKYYRQTNLKPENEVVF